MELKVRQRKILYWIVRDYIDTASPVGSHYLVNKYHLEWSPATVRNEMASLEEAGYIKQPHTSAGRVPADKGYRLYVDSLMRMGQLSPKEREHIHKRIEKAGGDVNLILGEASVILGKISNELSVVLAPWVSWGIFDRLELIGLSERKILVVIHVRNRLVKTVILEVPVDLNERDVEETASIFNERLSGLTLEEIQNTLKERMQSVNRGNRVLVRRIIESATVLFNFSEPLEIHTCGAQNILTQPEFSDISMLEHIFALIDDKKKLMHLFHRKLRDTEVTIGQENSDERLRPFAIIAAAYMRGKDIGTLGVIGPTRMPYRRVVPLVDYMAKTISQFLS